MPNGELIKKVFEFIYGEGSYKAPSGSVGGRSLGSWFTRGTSSHENPKEKLDESLVKKIESLDLSSPKDQRELVKFIDDAIIYIADLRDGTLFSPKHVCVEFAEPLNTIGDLAKFQEFYLLKIEHFFKYGPKEIQQLKPDLLDYIHSKSDHLIHKKTSLNKVFNFFTGTSMDKLEKILKTTTSQAAPEFKT